MPSPLANTAVSDISNSLPSSEDALAILSQICDTYHLGSVEHFRFLLESTNTVISGSWALLALFPDAFIPGDLDFFTAGMQDISINPLVPFLYLYGYREVSTTLFYPPRGTSDSTNIAFVVKLRKPAAVHPLSINIIVSRTISEIQPIFRFHSTVVMNYIAWYGIVCLYPDLTLRRRGLINDNILSPHVVECINKYINRGFDMQLGLDVWDDTRQHLCGIDYYCPTTLRFLLGGPVRFVPFESGTILSDFVGNMSWMLRGPCQT